MLRVLLGSFSPTRFALKSNTNSKSPFAAVTGPRLLGCGPSRSPTRGTLARSRRRGFPRTGVENFTTFQSFRLSRGRRREREAEEAFAVGKTLMNTKNQPKEPPSAAPTRTRAPRRARPRLRVDFATRAAQTAHAPARASHRGHCRRTRVVDAKRTACTRATPRARAIRSRGDGSVTRPLRERRSPLSARVRVTDSESRRVPGPAPERRLDGGGDSRPGFPQPLKIPAKTIVNSSESN